MTGPSIVFRLVGLRQDGILKGMRITGFSDHGAYITFLQTNRIGKV